MRVHSIHWSRAIVGHYRSGGRRWSQGQLEGALPTKVSLKAGQLSIALVSVGAQPENNIPERLPKI